MASDILDLKSFIWTSIDHWDVWQAFHEAVQSREGNYRVHKVKAHTSELEDVAEFDKWTRFHNDRADHFAKKAQEDRSEELTAIHAKLLSAEFKRVEVVGSKLSKNSNCMP